MGMTVKRVSIYMRNNRKMSLGDKKILIQTRGQRKLTDITGIKKQNRDGEDMCQEKQIKDGAG